MLDSLFDLLFGWMPNWLLFIIFVGLLFWGLDSWIRHIVRDEISDLESRIEDLEDR